MSKTFKNAHTVHGKMTVREDGGCVSVSVNMDSPSDTIIHLAPSDAPALMQAIVECLPPLPNFVRDGSYEAYMAVVVEYLDRAVRALEAETAKAKEQSELETCALEMLNALREHYGKPERSWEDTHVEVREEFLVLARRARELGSR